MCCFMKDFLLNAFLCTVDSNLSDQEFPIVKEPTCSPLCLLCLLNHAISHSPKLFIRVYIFVILMRLHGTGFS